jgi:two-component system cell cycle response regulator
MAFGSSFRQLGVWLTAPPDEALADAAREGEMVVARIRTWCTLLLVASPLLSMLIDGHVEENLLGLGMVVAAVVIAVVIERVLQHGYYRPGLSYFTSTFDVTLISLCLLGFWAAGDPIVTVNSRVLFECYFLAIGASALRYEPLVTLTTGLVAIAEYGRFEWSSVFSRGIVLFAMTSVALAIVSRAQRLRRLSTGDRLTALFNRAYVEEYLGNEVLRTARGNGALVVGMLDVDRFKNFNDTFGHAAGDAALRQVAMVLRSALRRSDVVARHGGDEVLIVLPSTELASALEKLEEIRVRIGLTEILLPRGGKAQVTVSIGVAAWDHDGRAVDALLDVADARLYAAKNAGRNRVFGPADMPTVPLPS